VCRREENLVGPGSERALAAWAALTNITCPSATWKCARGGRQQRQMAQLCIPGEQALYRYRSTRYLFHFVSCAPALCTRCCSPSWSERANASIPLLLLSAEFLFISYTHCVGARTHRERKFLSFRAQSSSSFCVCNNPPVSFAARRFSFTKNCL
jgi:hypothetical protein